MNLIDLVVLVCSLANPTSCGERHLILDAQGSAAQCSMQAQPYLAQWIGEHPGLRIARWRCMWPQLEQKQS
jgi:hypothetical protein